MSEPLDMPDGPGWWGGRIDGQAVVCHWLQFEAIGDDLNIRWADDDYTMTYSLSWFKSHYRGVKWYRLTMPWDEPQPTIPPDVRETLRETIQRERDSLARHTNERKQYYAIYKRWPDGDDSLVTRWTDKLSRYDAALAWLDAQGGGRNG